MRNRLTSRLSLLILSFAVALLVFPAMAFAETVAPDGTTSSSLPTIQSDQADYPPGGAVTLTGSGWQPGESVHINVNDTYGASWSRNVDVTADASGNITDSFNLPDYFVSDYDVTATGAQSGTVRTTFTDSNPQTLVVSPPSNNVTQGGISGPYSVQVNSGGNTDACTTTLSASGLPTGASASFTNNPRTGSGNYTSVLTVSTTNATPVGSHNFTVTMTRGGNCQGSGNLTAQGTLVVTSGNQAPAIARNNASVSVNEGQTANNTGTWSDANAGDTVALSASVGTVTKSGTNSGGTWSWSYPTTDGTDQSQTVTITANDGKGGVTSTTFSLTVANVAPTVTLNGPANADEGQTKTYTYTVSDPGNDTFTTNESCGANGTKTDTAAANSFDCTFPDGPASSNVTVQATDSDGAAGNTASQSVTVANVKPSVVLSGPANADEGQTKTYTYTVSDPGNDTYTAAESCGANGTKTDTAAANSFDCTFPDGPATSDVTVQVTDSDGATDTDNQQVTVNVVNVPPALTAPADQSSNEGESKSFSLGSFTDPGPDGPWNVTVDWGDGSTPTTFASGTGMLAAQSHTYADEGTGTYTVSVKVAEAGSGTTPSDTKTFKVTVSNVKPTISLTGDASADEGTTHTYSYTVTDPGVNDTHTPSVSCDAPNGTLVAGSDTYSNATRSGTFKCLFPDGPATANVTATVQDNDGASDTDNQQVTVNVVNVPPAITAPADQTASEGSAASLNLGSFTDPGTNDGDWAVDVDWGDGSPHGTASSASTGSLGSMNHTYADGPATKTVTVKVTDKDGASDTKTFQVTVNNVAPNVTLDPNNDQSVDEGTTHTYNYTISDPGDDTVQSVSTDCGTNGTKVSGSDTNTNTSGSFKCTFPDGPASSTVSAKATDSDGASDTASESVQIVAIANVAPVVTAAANQSSNEGESKSFNLGSFTDPGANDGSWAVDVDWGDGSAHDTFDATSTGSLGTLNHTYADGPATHTVTVKVTDKDGASDSKTFQVTVSNVVPNVTLDPANDQSVDEGSTHTYNYTVSDPGDDTFTVSATYPNCGTGGTLVAGSATTTASGGSFDCSFPDGPATTSVAIKVADSDGASDTASESVQIVAIANVAPVVTAAANQSASEGSSATFNLGSFTDPGSDSPWAVDVDWGDGSTDSVSASSTGSLGSKSHTYADEGTGTYTVSVKVTDKDGESDTKTFTVTVSNVKPTISLTGDASADEGTTHTYSYTVTDPGVNDTHTPSVSCDAPNGTLVAGSDTYSNATRSGTFKCLFPDGPATANVTAKVTDNDGASDTDNQQVTVNVVNVPPAVTAAADQSSNEGESKSFSLGSFTDPGVNDGSWTVDVDWGDGSAHDTFSAASTGALGSKSHTYADGPATQTVTVKVTDKDGASDTKTFTVTVNNVAPNVTLDANNDLNVTEGSAEHTYNYTISDPGQDTQTVVTSCGANGTKVSGSDTNTNTSGSFKCTFPDGPASSTVSAKATDSDGASDTASESVQIVAIANVAPVVTAAANQSSNEGESKSFNLGSFTDPGSDSPWAVDVDWGDGSAHDTFSATSTGSLGTLNHTYADGPATKTVTVKVTDKDGASDTKTFTVTVNNVAPNVTLDANNDQSVDEGTTHTYSYTISDPGDDTVQSVSTDCGTNGTKVTGSDTNTNTSGSFKCTFPDGPASSTVSAKATDSDGASDTASESVQIVAIANVAPVVTAAANQSASEGSSATFNLGSFTDPGSDSPWAVDVDWGDGSAHGTASMTSTGSLGTMNHTYADGPATKTVTVKVTDKDGASHSQTFQVNVNNVAPNVTLSGPATADEGTTKHYTYTVSDPGDDTFTVSATYPNCGTGGTLVAGSATTTASGGSFDCSFPDGPATTSVAIKVADSDGASDTASESVQIVAIANVAPVVTAAANQSASEGSSATFNLGSFTDPGSDSPWAVDVDWGDGSAHGTASMTSTGSLGTMNHTYADSGPYTVTVKVTDKDGASDTKSFTVTVNNVAPTLTPAANQSSNEGQSKLFTLGSFSDPGPDSPWAVDVNWGDGSAHTTFTETASGPATAQPITAKSHTYADEGTGTYTVTVKVTDKNGGSDTKTFTVNVSNVNPTASNASFVFDPILGTATAGFDFSDVGYLDTHNLSYFTWSDVGNRPASVTEENLAPDATGHASDTRTLAPGCYPNMKVTGTAKDNDGGTSAPLTLYSSAQTSVYANGFRPPIQDNERNIAKYGNVVPVKVQLTNPCTGGTVTNASLYITLAKGVGNEAIEDTNVIAESVSSADTGSQMRVADGGYIFNLSTKNMSANSDWTVRVRLGSTTGPVLLQAVFYPKK